MNEIPLACHCGNVRGVIHDASAHKSMHVVCYCDDCQAFARFLRRENEILDEWGGTAILQMIPPAIEIMQGADQIRCLQLTPKGLHRWYTACCKTAVANTLSAAIPFAGVIRDFIADDVPDSRVGPVCYRVQGKYAYGTPADDIHPGFPVGSFIRVIPLLALAWLRRQHRLSPFYDKAGKPVAEPKVLSVS